MLRHRLAGAVAGSLSALAVLPGGAHAAPAGGGLRTLDAVCEGRGTIQILASSGNAVWIDGRRYSAASATFGGQTQTFGVKAGFPQDALSCVVLGDSTIPATFLPVPGR